MKRLLLAAGLTITFVSFPLAAQPSAPDPSWESRALQGIAAAEYRFSWSGAELSAPNRMHDLRTRVAPDGFSIVSRTSEDDFRLELRLLDQGPGIVAQSDERAEIRRPALTEWLTNDPRGIEHGITITRPTAEEDDPLVLTFALGGDVLAYPEGTEGTSVLFRNGRGEPVIRYGELAAVDAVGTHLPARMDVTVGKLTITVDDTEAVYPIEVDPLATSPSWEKLAGQTSARLGNSASTAGDVNGDGYSDVIVSAFAYDDGETDEGKVWVYLGGPSGLAVSPSWTAQGNQAGANMGVVSTAGDVNGDGYDDVIVGAFGYDSALVDRGAAFVWLGSATGLGPDGTPANADWSAMGEQAGSYFGARVVRAGDVNGDGYDDIAVSAYGDDFLDTDQGRVFAYYGGLNGPSTTHDWFYSPGDASGPAAFGLGLAAAGDVNGDGYDDLLIGAPQFNGTLTMEGAAWLIPGSSTGLHSYSWFKTGGQANARFGFSVAGVGDVNGDGLADIAVGSPTWDDISILAQDTGRLDLWIGRVGTIPQASDWIFVSGQAFAQLGFSLAAAGDVNGDGFADILAGSDVWNGSFFDEGKAWLFYGRAGFPLSVPNWTVTGGQNNAYLGDAVATAGDVNGDGYSDLLIGVYGWDGAFGDEGAVRAYLGGPDGPRTTAAWTRNEVQTFSEYGWSLAGAGDVNGDGYSDAIVGAYLFDLGAIDDGAVFIYHGGPNGLSTTVNQSFGGGQAGAWCGYSVAGAGDVNGDGYADVAIGCPAYDNPESVEGKVMICKGSGTGVNGPCLNLEANQAFADLGWSVAGVGDVNGDGLADVMMGAPLGDGSQLDQGLAYLAYGASPNGPTGLVQIGATSAQESARFGNAIAGGDFNRDGYSDVVIAAEEWANFTGGHAGKIFLFMGGSGGLSTTAAGFSREGNAQDRLGRSVACAGDVNGDGFADLLVGIPGKDNPEADEGQVQLYLGDSSGIYPFPVWSFESNQTSAVLGQETGVASAGDVNNDGYSDVLVGAPFWDEGATMSAGKAWLFLGSPGGLSGTAAWSVTGPGSGGNGVGAALAPAGDVNGDGFADFLVGAPQNLSGGSRQGTAYLYLGNGLGGRPRLPRQKNFAFTRNVAPQGMLDADGALGVSHTLIAPAGWQLFSIEVETKPLSAPLDGTGTVVLGGLPRVIGSRVQTLGLQGLTALTPYHWRVRGNSPHPFFPRTPWFSIPDLGVTLTDFRTPCQVIHWYRDLDGDGHGNPSLQQFMCTQPGGYVALGDDCDDTNPVRFPGNPEICDGWDNDCNNLSDDIPRPLAAPGMTLSKIATTAFLNWGAASGATAYDVVRGGIASLRAFGGDFSVSVVSCLADNGTATTASDPSVPGTADGWWYLVRGVNCGGGGTYNDGNPQQSGSRDAEIAASGAACP